MPVVRDTNYTLYVTGRTDPTFQNIWAFADEMERTAFLALKPSQQILNNKYWRTGAPIKVPLSYEDSFQYDYVKIVNRAGSEDEQTFYCFITGRLYISKNSTMLNLDVDYVQTYYFSRAIDDGKYPFWQIPGFLESATYPNLHAPRGTPSEYPVPETVCSGFVSTSYQNEIYALAIYSTYDLETLYTSDVVQTRAGLISNVPMTALPYLIVGTSSVNTTNIFNTLIEKVNTKGITESITGVYLVPINFINLASTPLNTVTLSWTLKAVTLTLTPPVACDGYTPVNSELLGYDYSYLLVSNGAGEITTFHYEDFTGSPEFSCLLTLSAGYPVISCAPENYKYGVDANFRSFLQKIATPVFIPYLNDSYKIWLAQTQNSRQAALNGANLAISQAEEARANSWAYQNGELIKEVENRLGAYIPGKLADISGGLSELMGEDRSTRGSGAGRRFGDVDIPYGGSAQLTTPSYGSRYGEDEQVWRSVYNIATGYINKQLGIETTYTFDHAVANAQQALNQLMAGYRDKAALPATATGSNAYGDLTTFQQYAFQLFGVTPTAQYAEWIDKTLSASGHVINQYINSSLTKKHTVFDYVRLLSPRMERQQDIRPVFVHNLLVSLLTSGIYLWYLDNNGDISKFIGAPYGINNPEVV